MQETHRVEGQGHYTGKNEEGATAHDRLHQHHEERTNRENSLSHERDSSRHAADIGHSSEKRLSEQHQGAESETGRRSGHSSRRGSVSGADTDRDAPSRYEMSTQPRQHHHTSASHDSEQKLTFRWPYGGHHVEVRGSWDHWQKPIQLHKAEGNTFVGEMQVPSGSHGPFEYKFIVDGQWAFDKGQKHVQAHFNGAPVMNNVYEARDSMARSA